MYPRYFNFWIQHIVVTFLQNYLVSVTAGGPWSPRGHIAKFYSRLRSICSVWRAQNFLCFKLIEIVILWVYYTIPFGFSLYLGTFGCQFSTIYNYFVWLRITDEGSVPEMRIWSIWLIQSDLKWCIHLSISLFLYCNISISTLH